MQISIDTKHIEKLAGNAEELFISPSGEQHLVELLDIKAKVDEAVEEAKLNLEEKALEINPNFQSIRGEQIKISYRSFGAKYQIIEDRIGSIPEELIEKHTKYTLNQKELKAYIKTNRKLPQGITSTDRAKKIVFGRIK